MHFIMSTQLRGTEGLPQSCPCTRWHSPTLTSTNSSHSDPDTYTGRSCPVHFSAAVTDSAGGGKGLSALQAAGRGACLSYRTAAAKRHHAQGCLSEIACGSSGLVSPIIMAGCTAAAVRHGARAVAKSYILILKLEAEKGR